MARPLPNFLSQTCDGGFHRYFGAESASCELLLEACGHGHNLLLPALLALGDAGGTGFSACETLEQTSCGSGPWVLIAGRCTAA